MKEKIFKVIRFFSQKGKMKKFKIFISLIMLLLVLNSCSTTIPLNLELYFSKSEYNINVGSSWEITVMIRNAGNLYACAMEIIYDPTVASYEAGSLCQGSCWLGGQYKFSKEDEHGLSICIGLEQAGSFSGDGDLFSFKLIGLSPNETTLKIENVSLIDENGNYISGFDSLNLRNSYLIVQ